MSDLNPRGIPILVNGEERHLLFTLNIVDEIQERYGKTLSEVIDDVISEDITGHMLRDLLVLMLNDEVAREKHRDPESSLKEITEQDAGWIIGLDNQIELISSVLKAYGVSLPEPEDDDPNRESGQTSN